MEFLGVGPAELFFILVLALLVIGPERLPEVGRFLGRLVARVLAWQQQSSEVQAIQQIHQEIQGEIVSLRDEMVRTKKQMDANMNPLQEEVRSLKGLSESLALSQSRGRGPAIPRAGRSAPVSNGHTQEEDKPVAETGAADTTDTTDTTDSATNVPQNGTTDPTAASLPVQSLTQDIQAIATEQQAMLFQLQTVMSDVHALVQYLREQGVVAPEWTPPSHQTAHPAPPSSPSPPDQQTHRENKSV